ncbi:hypothetical protein, partial [Enterobacter bugandensis]|uniref:hypothetical protein n=1 Tax=Enterobacter bugandensis TaxID=881260 RepID=UPI00195426DA
ARGRDIASFRIAAIYGADVAEVDESYAEVLRGLVRRLRQLGATVDEHVKPAFDFTEHHRLFIQPLSMPERIVAM